MHWYFKRMHWYFNRMHCALFVDLISVSASGLAIKQTLMSLPFFDSSAETVTDVLQEELTGTSWRFTIGFRSLGQYSP